MGFLFNKWVVDAKCMLSVYASHLYAGGTKTKSKQKKQAKFLWLYKNKNERKEEKELMFFLLAVEISVVLMFFVFRQKCAFYAGDDGHD